jgi:hypothetical protein
MDFVEALEPYNIHVDPWKAIFFLLRVLLTAYVRLHLRIGTKLREVADPQRITVIVTRLSS